MQRLRTRSFGMMGIALAMALLLASLADMRMQGRMAGDATGLAGLAALCSGERAPQQEDGTPAAHVHCVLCNLPVALAATPPHIAAPGLRIAVLRASAAVSRAPGGTALVYRSRAPPLAG